MPVDDPLEEIVPLGRRQRTITLRPIGRTLCAPQIVHRADGDPHAAVGGGTGGHRGVAVDGDAAVEVPRPVQGAQRPGVPAVDRAEDAVGAARGHGVVCGAAALVVGAGAGGRVEHEPDRPVVHDQQHLVSQVDLDDITRAAAGPRPDAGLQHLGRSRAEDAVAGQAGDLLQGGDRVGGGGAVHAVGRAEPVAERGQALLRGQHGGTPATEPEHRGRGRRGDRGGRRCRCSRCYGGGCGAGRRGCRGGGQRAHRERRQRGGRDDGFGEHAPATDLHGSSPVQRGPRRTTHGRRASAPKG